MSRNQSGDDLSVDQTVNDEMVYTEEEKEFGGQHDGQAGHDEDSEVEAEMEGSGSEISGVMSGVQEETPEDSGTPQESPAGTGKTPSRTAIGAQPQPIRSPDRRRPLNANSR